MRIRDFTSERVSTKTAGIPNHKGIPKFNIQQHRNMKLLCYKDVNPVFKSFSIFARVSLRLGESKINLRKIIYDNVTNYFVCFR